MEIATWNVDFKRDPYRAMKYLEEKIQPDISFIQELPNPEGYKLNGKFVWERVPESFNWGSAVYSRNADLEDLGFGKKHPEYRGRVVFARMPKGSGRFIYLASIHCPLKSEKFGNFVVPILKDIFKKLVDFYAAQSKKEDYLIIGGDLNASRNFDEHYEQSPETKHVPFFAWVQEELGLVDVHWSINRKEVKTIRHPRGIFDYQNDHIFVSEDLREKISECRVLSEHAVEKLSDHNPVVMELDL